MYVLKIFVLIFALSLKAQAVCLDGNDRSESNQPKDPVLLSSTAAASAAVGSTAGVAPMVVEPRTLKVLIPPQTLPGPLIAPFQFLSTHVIGQDHVAPKVFEKLTLSLGGLGNSNGPLGVFLLLGETGMGKTHFVKMISRALSPEFKVNVAGGNLTFINCGEFQSDHEVAKLMGAPPGYLGYAQSRPILSEAALIENAVIFNGRRLYIILFDEIEKAAPALQNALLGVLSHGFFTLGTGEKVDMRDSLIFMTSNLGVREMNVRKVGFGGSSSQNQAQTAEGAARRHFSPEFMNRVSATVTFNRLDRESLKKIVLVEYGELQRRILDDGSDLPKFVFRVSEEIVEILSDRGLESEGARSKLRAMEQVTLGLAKLREARSIKGGDEILVDIDPKDPEKVIFTVTHGGLTPEKMEERYKSIFGITY